MATNRLQRSPHIVFCWQGKKLLLRNYWSRVQATASPILIKFLGAFDKARTVEEVIATFPEFSKRSVRRAIKELKDLTILERVSPGTIRRDRKLEQWAEWGAEARLFHWATKNVRYVTSRDELRKAERKRRKRAPEPPMFKRYSGLKRLQLPSADLNPAESFLEVLRTRRTHREFSNRAISLSELATLLKLTWGISGYVSFPGKHLTPLKTSPSGGARHPIEVYVFTLKVNGLHGGMYHYAPERHELQLMRLGDFSVRMEEYCAGQWWVGTAAAVFFMTAVFERTMWRYGSARALRTIYMEAGHLCQTFCLTATALGLAPFCTAALEDTLIENDLGLDGITESVLYVSAVGHPMSYPFPKPGRYILA